MGSTGRIAVGLVVLVLLAGGGVWLGCYRTSEKVRTQPPGFFRPKAASITGPNSDTWQFELSHDFLFVDDSGKAWIAPKGTLTDGASIPRQVLSITGDPFRREFLYAAIVHDAYCAQANAERGASYQTDTWENVHRMFYDACKAGGASETLASTMYAAVLMNGPRWTTVRPVTLSERIEELLKIAEEGAPISTTTAPVLLDLPATAPVEEVNRRIDRLYIKRFNLRPDWTSVSRPVLIEQPPPPDGHPPVRRLPPGSARRATTLAATRSALRLEPRMDERQIDTLSKMKQWIEQEKPTPEQINRAIERGLPERGIHGRE